MFSFLQNRLQSFVIECTFIVISEKNNLYKYLTTAFCYHCKPIMMALLRMNENYFLDIENVVQLLSLSLNLLQ